MSPFKQAPHDLLVIPGPIEVADSVLYANAHPSMSHVSKDFIPVFGDCIRMTREVVYAGKSTQPFLISGSGTLGWDQVAANLVEDGEEALVVHSGYFGDSFADWLVNLRRSELLPLIVPAWRPTVPKSLSSRHLSAEQSP